MDKKEFLDVSREYFKSIGFQTLKKSKFYFESNDLILRVWADLSNFSELYYLDYHIRIKAFHPNEQFNDIVWDAVGRLCYDPENGFEIDYLFWEKEKYINKLKEIAEKQLLPLMQGGIKYVKKLVRDCKSFNSYVLFKKDDIKRILAL